MKDLSPEQKQTIENLLGRPVSNEEAVSVRSVFPATVIPSKLSPAQRTETIEGLDRYFAKVDANRQPVSDEEEDAIINEAMRSVRPNYRPVD